MLRTSFPRSGPFLFLFTSFFRAVPTFLMVSPWLWTWPWFMPRPWPLSWPWTWPMPMFRLQLVSSPLIIKFPRNSRLLIMTSLLFFFVFLNFRSSFICRRGSIFLSMFDEHLHLLGYDFSYDFSVGFFVCVYASVTSSSTFQIPFLSCLFQNWCLVWAKIVSKK